MIMKKPNTKGITLIEMVIIISVLGVAIPGLLKNWADVSWRSVGSELLADATFYARGLLEEIQSKNFDEKTAPNPSWSTTLGADTGETSSSLFDDVDDFNGYSDLPGGGFTRTVAVAYILLSGSSWVDATPAQSPTDYKRVTVTVAHNNNFVKSIQLQTIVSYY
jgi:MSHA pilin protein MshD